MSGEMLASKVIVQEVPPQTRGIAGVSSSITGAVGVTERGPLNTPTLITSPGEYAEIFGGYVSGYYMAQFVAGFFENGGASLYITRTCHHTDVDDAATATAEQAEDGLTTGAAATPARLVGGAPTFNLEPGDVIVLDVDEAGDDTATFDAAAATCTAVGAATYDLTNDDTLTVQMDSGETQTITFTAVSALISDIDAVTAAEVVATINDQILGGSAAVVGAVPVISSDTRGTSSGVQVIGGAANDVFLFPTALQSGTGDVADINAVTAAEVETVVEADIAGVAVDLSSGNIRISTVATGVAVTLEAGAATADAFGFTEAEAASGAAASVVDCVTVQGKTPGTYAHLLTVAVQAATSGVSAEFNLVVSDDGRVVERYPNLSMVSTADRYIETIVNAGSNLIAVTDLELDDAPRPTNQEITPAAGDDGLTDLADTDFIGSAAGATAMYAFVAVSDLRVLAIPGKASSAIHNAMLTYCDTVRDGLCFAVLDPAAGLSASEVVTYVETTAALLNASEHGAIYWPWCKIVNPSQSVFGTDAQITVPPSGIVCGIYARLAGTPGGLYESPAGYEYARANGVLGFETDTVLQEAVRDIVYPKRINPITSGTGLPRFVDGGRTLSSSGNFSHVAQRRGAIYIAASVKAGLEWARHRNNTPSLRARVRRSVTAFLVAEMGLGAFVTDDPATAFFVTCDSVNNPPAVTRAGQLIVEVGIAMSDPAEFVVFRLSQDTRAYEASL